jgi:hypothetical protein
MKFPLKTPILLISNSDIYLTSINFAGKDFITCNDIYKKYILKFDDDIIPKIGWIKISNNMILRKDLIIGYSNLENKFLLDKYNIDYKNDVIFENDEEENNNYNIKLNSNNSNEQRTLQ